jgi:GT2 family glycosyltransferase
MPSQNLTNLISKEPKVSVIILNYNGGSVLQNSIQSVLKSNYSNFNIIVIDNNSTDNSFQSVKKCFANNSAIEFICNRKNLGFGAGNNVGIKLAFQKGADFVFLLNNDAEVQKNTLKNLILAMQRSKKNVGLASPLIFSDKNYTKLWFSAGRINWWKMRAEHLMPTFSLKNKIQNSTKQNSSSFEINKLDFKKKNLNSKKTLSNFKSRKINQENYLLNIQTTEYITGCAMLISRQVFEKVGLFDEQFFLYYEDADLSYRVNQVGLKNIIVKNSQVYHQEKSEENQAEKIYWLVLSGILFFQKHAKGWRKIYFQSYLFLRKLKNFLAVKFFSNEINRSVKQAFQDVLFE